MMRDGSDMDSMIEIYVQETKQLLEHLENTIIDCEEKGVIHSAIGEIFRVMHTIKGNSMMMEYNGIAKAAHALEDMFDYLRSGNAENVDYGKITDLVLETVDYIKSEIIKITENEELSENTPLQEKIHAHLESLKFINGAVEKNDSAQNHNYYVCTLFYENDCDMVNVRAYLVVNKLGEVAIEHHYYPQDLNDEEASTIIKSEGLKVAFISEQEEAQVATLFSKFSYIDHFVLNSISKQEYQHLTTTLQSSGKMVLADKPQPKVPTPKAKVDKAETNETHTVENKFINVKVNKLDQLLNLISELVVAEAMVTRNPELENLKLDGFMRSAKHMRNIINDLQDVVMEIRMVPLALTFQKMKRLVRDMSRKTHKEIELKIIGQETEVDKNIIEHLADPLMHLLRNAIDHGIEDAAVREQKGKNPVGQVTLEAKHAGREIIITVKDDGKGLDKEQILLKAEEKGLLYKAKEAYSDEEIYQFIYAAGFSTKNKVTAFSGRGVGMDVVVNEIESINGKVYIQSEKDVGTEIIIRIPLTLAIINSILVTVGKMNYAVPITSIKQMFKAKESDLIIDPAGNEMILFRNKCLSIQRIYQLHNLKNAKTKIDEGILLYIENDGRGVCLLVDEVIGEYQLVVKTLSKYLLNVKGIGGCALLANGDICFILDTLSLIN